MLLDGVTDLLRVVIIFCCHSEEYNDSLHLILVAFM